MGPIKLELMPGVWVNIVVPYQDSETEKFECECDKESMRKLEAEARLRGMPLKSLIEQLFQEALDRGALEFYVEKPPKGEQ